MLIRSYNKSDTTAIMDLLKLNTPEYFSPLEEPDLIDYLHNHAVNYFVVEINEGIYGCGGYNKSDNPELIRISWDIIHPQYQGKGLGTELTNFRIKEIQKIPGVKIISVRTSQLVYRFYEKFGFVLKEVAKDFWAKGFDMYRMERGIHL